MLPLEPAHKLKPDAHPTLESDSPEWGPGIKKNADVTIREPAVGAAQRARRSRNERLAAALSHGIYFPKQRP
jgi:hypothetical protein